MGEQSVDVVRAIYEAFGRGDVPGVLGAFDGEIEWYEAEGMPYGGLHRGLEAVAQSVFGPIAEDVENFAVSPEEFIASGDTVAAVVRYTGTGRATGKGLDLPVVHVWDIRGGKAALFRQFADTAKFLEGSCPLRPPQPRRAAQRRSRCPRGPSPPSGRTGDGLRCLNAERHS